MLEFLEWALSLTTEIQQPHQSLTTEWLQRSERVAWAVPKVWGRWLILGLHTITIQPNHCIASKGKQKLIFRPQQLSNTANICRDKRISPFPLCHWEVQFLKMTTQTANHIGEKRWKQASFNLHIKIGSSYGNFTPANTTGLVVRNISKGILPHVLQKLRYNLNIQFGCISLALPPDKVTHSAKTPCYLGFLWSTNHTDSSENICRESSAPKGILCRYKIKPIFF